MNMQRLLRGRLLYIVLGTLVLFLYARAASVGKPEVVVDDVVPPEERHAQAMTWWPSQIDAQVLKRITAQEPGLTVALSIFTIAAAGLGLGGILLTGWALMTGRLRSLWRFPSRRLPRWSLGELSRILLLTLMVASLLPFIRLGAMAIELEWAYHSDVWIVVAMLFLDLFVMLSILTLTIGKGRSLGRTLGCTGQRLGVSIGAGLQGYVALFPWLFLILFVAIETARALGFRPPIEPIHRLIFEERQPAVLGLTVVLACLVGPVAEELLFRGVLYPAIRQRSSRTAGMLVSGAVFSLVHTNLIGFIPIMALGCLLAYLYERTGSLAAPLAVHIIHNSLLMGVALLLRRLVELA